MNRLLMLCLFSAIAFGLSAASWAAEKKESAADKEAREAAEEDQAEVERTGELREELVSGTLSLTSPDTTRTDLAGTFKTARGVMNLKLADPALLNELKKLDGKTVELYGRVRNQGKTFLAVRINPGAIPAVSGGKRRGF